MLAEDIVTVEFTLEADSDPFDTCIDPALVCIVAPTTNMMARVVTKMATVRLTTGPGIDWDAKESCLRVSGVNDGI